MQLATFQTPRQRDEHPLAAELRDVVITADRERPRSLQTAIGPSSLGQPCLRRLAYQIMNETPINIPGNDLWAAIVGTAIHFSLAEAFVKANRRLGRIRYLVEQRVEVRPGLEGNCDLYDADRATVLDHKSTGLTALREYRINGPSPEYRVQAHAYGTGYIRLGLPVNHVAIAFYPRSNDLSKLHVWSEPYNPEIVTDAFHRHDTLLELICALDVERHPDRYTQLPRTPSRLCMYCPWFKPGPGPDPGTSCPGDTT
ncbi:MAG: hypothetical protein LC749_17760 [Actinobacteria bacterium]|nr:hypothetical protein [Actinomycetota bacterium]